MATATEASMLGELAIELAPDRLTGARRHHYSENSVIGQLFAPNAVSKHCAQAVQFRYPLILRNISAMTQFGETDTYPEIAKRSP